MDNYHCYTLLDAYLQTGIYGMHRNLREGRKTPKLLKKRRQPKCTQTFSNTKPADSTGYPWGPVAERRAAQARLLLPIPNESATDQLKSICAAQPQRPVLLPPAFGLSPSKRVDLCCSVEASTYCLRKAAYFSWKNEMRIDMLCSKLDQGPCMNTPHISVLYLYQIYVCWQYMHLYRNHINLSNKSYADMTMSLIPGSSTELDPDPGGASIETSCKLNWSSQHFWTWHNF